MKHVNIIGVNVNCINMKIAIGEIEKKIKEKVGAYVSLSNVHTTVTTKKDKEFHKVIENAFLVLPDGKPLSWYGKLLGYKDMEKVSGPDLMEEMLKVSEEKGYSNYFYGSTQENLQLLIKTLKKKHSSLVIAGYYSPPFRKLTDEEEKEIKDNINQKNPDIIWVGLGAPKQEKWMYNHVKDFKSIMIGVGAAFNFFTGTVKRAPKWMQDMGLEWFYRLMQEPGRLWKRYLVTNILFVYYCCVQLLKGNSKSEKITTDKGNYKKLEKGNNHEYKRKYRH